MTECEGIGGRSVPGERVDAVDIARGIGIILVVYAHALRGLVTAGLAEAGSFTALQDAGIYAFHMPLFFVLAGMFIERGVRRGRRSFATDKLATVAYPYVLWSTIHVICTTLLAGWVNTPVHLSALPTLAWKPVAQFWFLYALFVGQMIAMLVVPRLGLLAVVAVAGVVAFVASGTDVMPVGSLLYLPYVAVGVFCGRAMPTLLALGTARVVATGALSWALFSLVVLLQLEGLGGIASLLISYAAGLLGTAGIVAVSLLLSGRAPLLAMLGRASMAIFVMHTIVSAGLRITLAGLWPAVPSMALLVLCTLASLALPVLAWRAAERLGLSGLLGIGRPLAARRPAPTAAVPGPSTAR